MNSSDSSKLRTHLLWELRWPEVQALDPERTVILLPTGSIEQHGYHLPLDTDIHDSFELCRRTAERAAQQFDGAAVLVAPPVWWGTSPHHMAYPGTISLEMSTMSQLLTDICRSLTRHGLYRIVMVNGHGGNQGVLQATAVRIMDEIGVSVFAVTYWHLIRPLLVEIGESLNGGMGHACEMETSLQLHLRPEMVDTANLRVDLPADQTSYTSTDFRQPGPVMFPWDFTRDSRTGTMGDPTVATAQKGARIADASVAELVKLVGEILLLAPNVVFPRIDSYRFTRDVVAARTASL